MKRMKVLSIIIIGLITVFSCTISAQLRTGSNMNNARMSHYQVLLDDGSIWLVGGHGTNFIPLHTAELMDSTTGSFALQTMLYNHDSGALVKMKDGKFLIAGGALSLGVPAYNTAEIYDPVAKTYTAVNAMKYKRTNCTGTTLTSGKVLIAGGWYDSNSPTYTEIYDPAQGKFTSNPALNVPRTNPMVFPTTDGGAVVFGGYESTGANTFYQSVEYYDATKDSFSVLQNTIFPNEEGYYISSLIKNITEAYKSKDGKYVFSAFHRTATDTEYVFISFDPATKEFKKLYQVPVPANDPFYLISSVIDTKKNVLYSLWKLPATPVKIGVSVLQLASNQMTMPAQWDELPSDYYPDYVGLTKFSDTYMLMTGGTSSNGSNTNFTPLNQTMYIPFPSVTGIKQNASVIPDKWELYQNYPNPFNPSTTIKYSIPAVETRHALSVQLNVYDILGREVATLVNKKQVPGNYSVQFDASSLTSGTYFYRISAGKFVSVKKMILLK